MQQGELTSALMHANGILSERYSCVCQALWYQGAFYFKASLDAVIKFVSYSSCVEAWTVEGTGGVAEDGEAIHDIHVPMIESVCYTVFNIMGYG